MGYHHRGTYNHKPLLCREDGKMIIRYGSTDSEWDWCNAVACRSDRHCSGDQHCGNNNRQAYSRRSGRSNNNLPAIGGVFRWNSWSEIWGERERVATLSLGCPEKTLKKECHGNCETCKGPGVLDCLTCAGHMKLTGAPPAQCIPKRRPTTTTTTTTSTTTTTTPIPTQKESGMAEAEVVAARAQLKAEKALAKAEKMAKEAL